MSIPQAVFITAPFRLHHTEATKQSYACSLKKGLMSTIEVAYAVAHCSLRQMKAMKLRLILFKNMMLVLIFIILQCSLHQLEATKQ